MAVRSIPSKVLMTANTAWYLYNFRLNLMLRLQTEGLEVVAVAPHDKYATKLVDHGIPFAPLAINSSGTNPVEDFGLFFRYYQLLRREKAGIVLSFTPKPNIYASIAAGLLSVPTINNISGLGRLFTQPGLATRITRLLYRIALRRAGRVFFQNFDDMQDFSDDGLVNKRLAERIPGSGVDTRKFKPNGACAPDDPFTFLLSGRLLWDKGVGEFVEAARLLRKKQADIRFQLLGFLDVDNPSTVTREQVQSWVSEGLIEYLGETDDVLPFLSNADCAVLPSYYREGVPRSLLEAASMAKPIITCDSVGCREVVDDSVNGLLCRPRDADDLASKMQQIIQLTQENLRIMGENGRKKILREFDEKIVLERYIQVIEEIL